MYFVVIRTDIPLAIGRVATIANTVRKYTATYHNKVSRTARASFLVVEVT